MDFVTFPPSPSYAVVAVPKTDPLVPSFGPSVSCAVVAVPKMDPSVPSFPPVVVPKMDLWVPWMELTTIAVVVMLKNTSPPLDNSAVLFVVVPEMDLWVP